MTVPVTTGRSTGEAGRVGGPPRVVGQRRRTPYLFILPGVVLFALMFAWPAGITLQLALSEYNIVTPIRWVGLDNFVRLMEDTRFHTALKNSLLFVLLYLPLSVVIPLFLAMLVNANIRFIQAFRVAYYLPVVTSMVAVAVTWRYLLSEHGVVNWVLSLVGIEPVSFLLNTHWALPTVVMIEGWKNMGLFMIIYLTALQNVSRDLIEATMLDGAGRVRQFWHVVLPAVTPYIAVTLTLGMLDAMRSFESIYMLTRGGPQDSTLTLGYYVWHLAFERYQMGYASAVGIVLWVIMVALALLNYRVTRRSS